MQVPRLAFLNLSNSARTCESNNASGKHAISKLLFKAAIGISCYEYHITLNRP